MWTCFAGGCGESGNFTKFCEAAGIPVPILKLFAEYEYKDEAGNLLYKVERWEDEYGGKTFKQRVWDPAIQDFKNSLGGCRRVLFRLPEITRYPNAKIIIVEGEKKAIALQGGLAYEDWIVTTTCGGANGWSPGYVASLAGRSVAILPDKDDAGEYYAKTIKNAIAKTVSELRIVSLPGLQEKDDVLDFLSAGLGTVADVLSIIKNTKPEAHTHKLINAMEGLAIPRPKEEWMINGIWPKGRGWIAGTPGSGKTWLAMDMALSVVTAAPWLDSYKATRGAVLFLQEEQSFASFFQKLGLLCKGRNISPNVLTPFVVSLQNFFRVVPDIEWLITQVKKIGAAAVFIDSFFEVVEGDENSVEEMRPVLQALRRLQNETGCSILIIHHFNKKTEGTAKQAAAQRLRGTASLWQFREAIIGLDSDPSDPFSAELSFEFKDAEPREGLKLIRSKIGAGEEAGIILREAPSTELAGVKKALLGLLIKSSQDLTSREILAAKAMRSIDHGLFLWAMQSLVKDGAVQEVEPGIWRAG